MKAYECVKSLEKAELVRYENEGYFVANVKITEVHIGGDRRQIYVSGRVVNIISNKTSGVKIGSNIHGKPDNFKKMSWFSRLRKL